MQLPVFQAGRNRESESVITIPDPGRNLLRGHHDEESTVHVDCHVNDVVVVASVPGVTRDGIAVGRVVAALIGGGAAAASDSFGRVPGQIRIGASKLNRYRVRLAVPQARGGREVEPVIGLPVYVCEVLTVLRGRDSSYQGPVGIDVHIDYVARIVGVPCPAADRVAARPVMGPLKARRSAASDVLGTAGQRDARA